MVETKGCVRQNQLRVFNVINKYIGPVDLSISKMKKAAQVNAPQSICINHYRHSNISICCRNVLLPEAREKFGYISKFSLPFNYATELLKAKNSLNQSMRLPKMVASQTCWKVIIMIIAHCDL